MWTQESRIWWITLAMSIIGYLVNESGVVFPDWIAPWLKHSLPILAIIAAALGASPLKRGKWNAARRLVETTKKIPGLFLVLALLPWIQACHGPINIQTNPVGAVAHYGKQVTDIVQTVQDVVITAEATKVPGVTMERIAPVVRATVEVGKQVQKLADALTELDGLPIGDLSRPTKIKAIGVILATTNAVVFNMVIPVGNDPLLIKIRDLVREVSVLLLTVQQSLIPSEPSPSSSPVSLDTGAWLRLEPHPMLA